MATILINAFLKNSGVPAIGLSPTIDIWNLDTSTLLINDAAMTEVGGGNYKYSYASYDATVNYSFVVDGTATLSDSDRYLQAGNDDPTILAPKLPSSTYIMGSAVATGKDDEIDVIKTQTDKLTFDGSNRIIADSQAISASTTAADGVESNIANLDATITSRAVAGDQMTLTVATINAIADQIWEELRVDHTTTGSYGKTSEWVGNVDSGAVADAVLDELMSGHSISGSLADFIKIIRKLLQNRYKHSGTTLTLYDDNNVTPLFTRTPKDKDGNAIDSANYSAFIPAEVTRAE